MRPGYPKVSDGPGAVDHAQANAAAPSDSGGSPGGQGNSRTSRHILALNGTFRYHSLRCGTWSNQQRAGHASALGERRFLDVNCNPRRELAASRIFYFFSCNPLKSPDSAKKIKGNASDSACFYLHFL
jgi:hypothetical protein